jgi:hypothetical protein
MDVDPKKLTVKALKESLEARGVDTSGMKKPDLVKALEDILDEEALGGAGPTIAPPAATSAPAAQEDASEAVDFEPASEDEDDVAAAPAPAPAAPPAPAETKLAVAASPAVVAAAPAPAPAAVSAPAVSAPAVPLQDNTSKAAARQARFGIPAPPASTVAVKAAASAAAAQSQADKLLLRAQRFGSELTPAAKKLLVSRSYIGLLVSLCSALPWFRLRAATAHVLCSRQPSHIAAVLG